MLRIPLRLFLSLLLLVLVGHYSFAQLSQGQYKALNNYVEYANQSADEVTAVVKSLITYYPRIFEKSGSAARYTCPIQLDEFYYNKVITESNQLGSVSAPLLASVNELRAVSEKIDAKCKALDTYHKLEDYKQDNYKGALKLIDEVQLLVLDYNTSKTSLQTLLEKSYKKLVPTPHPYEKTARLMEKEIERERTFLSLWKYNLRDDVSTGWIVDQLQKSISDTDDALKQLKPMKPVLAYPASSMWPSFLDALTSILQTKRRALDEYNFEAKKSDEYQNDVYLSIINYFNGALLADYNTFIGFASNNKYTGLKAIKFVPLFEINDNVKKTDITVSPFKDIPSGSIGITKQKTSISKPVFQSLVNYVDFINETWRTVSHHRDLMRNLNSSAAYYATVTSYAGKGGLNFLHDNFNLPRSHYQKVVSESKVLQPAHAAVLNADVEVLMNILKEMDEIGAILEQEVKDKSYQQDRVAHIYEMLERTSVLFETWDERKELLFSNVLKIFDAYPPAEPSGSWYRSGQSLRDLTELDHNGLFKAKAFYKGIDKGPVPTDEIDKKVRDVISGEFENMKGIQKLGRYNGLCPYTPYENLPQNSKALSEDLQKLKPAKDDPNNYQHPYHSMVYMYNGVVDDYNKFCDLSPTPLIKYIRQPELFRVVYPEDKPKRNDTERTSSTALAQKPVEEKKPSRVEETPKRSSGEQVKIIRDTVFIEKRDTVYLHDPGENLKSMEGYAINNMILLLDVSGSMNSPEKLPLLKKSILDMLNMMRAEDKISIVVFSGKPKVLLPSVSFKDDEKIRKAIDALKPSGKTDGNAGLKLAYKVADENYIRGGNNRIVLATDGEFFINPETHKLIGKFSDEDIFLTVFNFGNKSASSKNLERVAIVGKGNYEYISRENVELNLIREVKSKRSK